MFLEENLQRQNEFRVDTHFFVSVYDFRGKEVRKTGGQTYREYVRVEVITGNPIDETETKERLISLLQGALEKVQNTHAWGQPR